MASVDWDIESIGIALGAEVVTSKPDVLCVRLIHAGAGTRLRLEMAPALEAIRLWCDRNGNGRQTLLSRCDLFRVTDVVVDEGKGEVRFRTAEPNPSELLITEDATFHLTVGVLLDELSQNAGSPQPGTEEAPVAREHPDGDDVIHLVGKLARPHFSNRTGKPFFSAGLAEYPDGAMAPVWHNLKAFGGVALNAQPLERGQWVRLTGKEQEDRYQKAGQDMTKTVILLVHIEAAG